MVSVSVKSKKDGATKKFLEDITKKSYRHLLDVYGQKGVDALSQATPRNTGMTASSWSYQIVERPGEISIVWTNSNVSNGVPIALLLQYGHATRNGGYVEGIDYINPALKPIFDELAKKAWEVIVK